MKYQRDNSQLAVLMSTNNSAIVFAVPYVDRNMIASFVILLLYKDLTHYDSRRDALVGFVYYDPTKENTKVF